jgi:hypothetical protein
VTIARSLEGEFLSLRADRPQNNHANQKQNSGGDMFHAMYYNTERKIHKFTSPVIRRLVKRAQQNPSTVAATVLLIEDTWN